ncbi:MAG: hypothetical protein Q4C13_08885 [Clostridia bacterium]|nr:hypothetical protein [Clostridia bacterium]
MTLQDGCCGNPEASPNPNPKSWTAQRYERFLELQAAYLAAEGPEEQKALWKEFYPLLVIYGETEE